MVDMIMSLIYTKLSAHIFLVEAMMCSYFFIDKYIRESNILLMSDEIMCQ